MAAPTAPTRTYPSKRDGWLMILLMSGMVALLGSLILIWIEPASMGFRLGLTALVVGVTVLTMSLVAGTRYTVHANGILIIRTGPFRWRVPLDDITEIVPTRNPLSSPALSLDRLKIRYGRRIVLISPEDKAAFMRDVASRVEGLTYDGERVTRRVT